MPFKPHLHAPPLAPLSEGKVTFELSLGQVNFAPNAQKAFMQEAVTLLHHGQPVALGRVLRENDKVIFEIEQLP